MTTQIPPLNPWTVAFACMREWPPRTCRSAATDPAALTRSPIEHTCAQSTAFPHVCHCVRCGNQDMR